MQQTVNPLHDMQQAALSIAQDVRWEGASSVKWKTNKINQQCIEACRKLWQDGKLPVQVGEKPSRWVVGFELRVGWYSKSVVPLSVAPKRPRNFKDKFVRTVVLD